MDKSAADFVKEPIFFLVLVNPISRIFVLSFMSREATAQELRRAALTSSGLAWVLLLLFAAVGSAVLTSVFHVQIYALELAGGPSCSSSVCTPSTRGGSSSSTSIPGGRTSPWRLWAPP